MVTMDNPVQPANASLPMYVTELGMVALVSPLQQNADSPMVVTELPMVTLVSPLERNTDSPIVVTELPMFTLVRLLHPANAYLLMEVIVFGIVKSVTSMPFR